MLARVHALVASLLEHFSQGVFGKAAQMCEFVGLVRVKVGHFHQQKATILQQVGSNLPQRAKGILEMLENVHDGDEVELFRFIGLQLLKGRVELEAFRFRQLAVSVAWFHADHFGSIGFVDGLHQGSGGGADIQRTPQAADAVVLHQVQLVFRAQALLPQVLGGGFLGGLVELAVGLCIKSRICGSAFPGILKNKSAGLAEVVSDLEAERIHLGNDFGF